MRFIALLIALAFCAPTNARCQGHDLSRAVRYNIVWSIPIQSESSIGAVPQPVRFQQFADTDTDLIVVRAAARGTVAWTAAPHLDTVSRMAWPSRLQASDLKQIDYDGLPPLEYIARDGVVWSVRNAGGHFSMQAIDTIQHIDVVALHSSGDFDGDGYLDAVLSKRGKINGLTSSDTLLVVRGGPRAGRGDGRILKFACPANKKHNWLKRVWQSGDARWKLLIDETFEDVSKPLPYDSSGTYPQWLTLYVVEHDSMSGSVTFKKLDSLKGEGYHDYEHAYTLFRDPGILVDTTAHTDYIIWITENYGLRKVDISTDKFRFDPYASGEVRGVKDDIGYALNTPAYVFSASIGPLRSPLNEETLVLYRVDSIVQPYAIVWVDGKVNMCVVPDQTGDGLPDILVMSRTVKGQLVANLMSIDTAKVVYADRRSAEGAPELRVMGTSLEVTLDRAEALSIEISTLDGKVYQVTADGFGRVGANLFDLAPILDASPPGLYIVRVKTAHGASSIGYVR